MPKRACPFADAGPLQLKVRVGQRELSRGVCAEQHSREIFEKTKQLLFRGAQAYMDHLWEESCAIVDLPESPKPGPTEALRAARGQMLIGPDGRLTRSQAQTSEADRQELAPGSEELVSTRRLYTPAARPTSESEGCEADSSCGNQERRRNPLGVLPAFYLQQDMESQLDLSRAVTRACSSCVRALDGKAVCGQCERALCGRCVHVCCGCGAVACSLCALVDCGDVHETVLCAGCAMFEA